MKPTVTVFIYAAISREIRYALMSKGCNIESPDIYDLSKKSYLKLRDEVLCCSAKTTMIENTISDILEKVEYLLERNMSAESIEKYYSTGKKIAGLTHIGNYTGDNKKLRELLSLLDAAYLFALEPSTDTETIKETVKRTMKAFSGLMEKIDTAQVELKRVC